MQQEMDIHFEEESKVKEQLTAPKVEDCRLADELSVAQAREMSRVSEMEQAGNEAGNIKLGETRAQAQTQETFWINESQKEDIQEKQHSSPVVALDAASQGVRQELSSAVEAKHEATEMKENTEAMSSAEPSAKMIMDLYSELNSVKESLSKSNTELEVRQQKIDFLALQDERVKCMETELAEKDVLLAKLKHELHIARESDPRTAKEQEDGQIKELEETKALLEEAMLEITSLQKKVRSLDDSVAKSNEDLDKAKLDSNSTKEVAATLKFELEGAKEQLANAREEREFNLLTINSQNLEINMLRNELKSATEAEEKSKKAMDDLALVLIEVTNENKEVKESLSLTKSELDSTKDEAENAKKLLKPTEEKHQSLLEEAKKEIEQLKSECERLKLDAEDSVLAWNQKELEFVSCIKKSDEESDASKQENTKLKTSLRTAEDMANVAREENCKLRDILKQALNESSVAKETTEIARAENSQLKEELSDKEDMLEELTREIERLRIKETASYETIKELKMLLSLKLSENDPKVENMDCERIVKKQSSSMEHNDNQNIKEILNIKFEEPQMRSTIKKENGDPEIDEMLRGSIFDVAESPVAPRPVSHHRKMSSTVFSDAEEEKFHDLEQSDASQLEDTDDKNSQRKKKALLRRFGDLIRITSLIRRETPVS